MRTAATLAIAIGLLSTAIEGLVLTPRQDGRKVVGLQTERKPVVNPLHRDKLRRRDPLSVGLDNEVRPDGGLHLTVVVSQDGTGWLTPGLSKHFISSMRPWARLREA